MVIRRRHLSQSQDDGVDEVDCSFEEAVEYLSVHTPKEVTVESAAGDTEVCLKGNDSAVATKNCCVEGVH